MPEPMLRWMDADELSEVEVALLLRAALDLAGAREVAHVAQIVRSAARELTGADGVTFVLREGPQVHYLDEDAIAPLWKGMRFPAGACISGWAMEHRQAVVIEDVYRDDRIPLHAYQPTFVRSLAMVPVRPEDPVAAIGAYWAEMHRASPRELRHLTTLAGFASVALANAALVADLREAIAARDTFIGIASHELRTPVSALALTVELARRELAAGEPRREGLRGALDRLSRTARRLGGLVERLLDVSSLGQEVAPLRREAVDLVRLAREAADALAPASGAEVRVVADGAVVGRWDPFRLEQVVNNLLANALKFGAGKPVELRLWVEGGAARLAVSDRGIGIPEAAQARIFERWTRAVPAANYGGFGLGLWVVRENVEAHGGRVEVASAPGEGATFTVTLPLG